MKIPLCLGYGTAHDYGSFKPIYDLPSHSILHLNKNVFRLVAVSGNMELHISLLCITFLLKFPQTWYSWYEG